jgi:hypothetical protein
MYVLQSFDWLISFKTFITTYLFLYSTEWSIDGCSLLTDDGLLAALALGGSQLKAFRLAHMVLSLSFFAILFCNHW